MQLEKTCSFSSACFETMMPWMVCLCASLFFFYEFIQGNMFASIADNIMHDFNIQVNRMAYLSSVYYVANVLFLFVAGQMLDRYSPKKVMMAGMFLCVCSTFVLAQAQSFTIALICRFITGIGSAFCLLGPVRIASRWFPPQRMAMVTGLIVTVAMLGGMAAQYPMTWLVAQIGWRDAVWAVGWVGAAMWLLMGLGILDKPTGAIESTAQPMHFLEIFKRAFTNLDTIKVALFASLMNMAIAVFGAMMGSLYLMQRLDISKELASSINGMLFLGVIIGGPLMGRWSDRIGRRLLPMRVGVIGSLLVLLMVLYLPCDPLFMYVLFFALGLFTSAQVISYAYVAESQPHSMTATAVSVVSICTQSGYVLFQNMFSHLLLWHQQSTALTNDLKDYQFAAIMLPLGLVIACLLVLKLRETYCRGYEHI